MGRRHLLTVGALGAAAGTSLAALALADGGPAREQAAREVREPASRILSLRPLVPSDARVVRDPAHAVRLTLPPGWQTFDGNLTPMLAPSLPGILAVATFDPGARPRRVWCSSPDLPQTPIGPHDALVHAYEELDAYPGDLPRRPRRLKLRERAFPWRCLNRPGVVGLRTWFRAHGRLIWMTAVAGERTSTRRRRELLGIAQGVRIGPTPPVEVRVDPAVGRPDTRFRLDFESTHAAGGRRRRERSYRVRVHGPHGVACVIAHEAWFSHGPPGTRLRAVLDPRRTKGGRWCRGRFRGVVIYRDAFCERGGRCYGRPYVRRAGRVEFTVR